MKDGSERKRKPKGKKYNELKLYCQRCCARYSYCEWEETLHTYDTCAETCPDYLPNDIYKAVNQKSLTITNKKTSCYRKRLNIDSNFGPLPEIIPLWFWTKKQLETLKEYAFKKIIEQRLDKLLEEM